MSAGGEEQARGGVFGLYAAYYDLLYRDKDYAAEAAFVAGRLRAHAPGARSLLELGCGTGRHAALFSAMGFQVTGVDRSEGMLDKARANGPGCRFLAADIRELALDRRFDAVVSLFHVMSYLTEDADLVAALSRAAEHLAPGGLLFFDFWHGPAVLKTPAEVRVKEMADERVCVIRRADPVHHAHRHVVDVNFTVNIRERSGDRAETLRETHAMRYFFAPELEGFLEQAGLVALEFGEWMTGAPASDDAWSVYCLARKRG
ncbi:Methyltransferase domain-containing protein [Humidesulfovibrio mexicanus]|uniref:Methyltransferase domain-containing protein n=1 Tax=Humidesulfovibrio mexicanus TaxID=147047 RepID=A0A239BV13_9BACT|nr:class I SAM-dependent methyltransferase [Humidesulfovibrio mexicanus]SNS11766.1 Methyltransferase domain-containing protein [Humidesulfovibrio mexicanus]